MTQALFRLVPGLRAHDATITSLLLARRTAVEFQRLDGSSVRLVMSDCSGFGSTGLRNWPIVSTVQVFKLAEQTHETMGLSAEKPGVAARSAFARRVFTADVTLRKLQTASATSRATRSRSTRASSRLVGADASVRLRVWPPGSPGAARAAQSSRAATPRTPRPA